MLADDSSATQNIFTLAFKDIDYEVICLSDGVEVLEHISHSPVDLVLIDVDLPGIDGYQLCEVLKKDSLTAHIPVVLMGSIKSPVDREKIQKHQPSALLEKPFETRELLELVERLLTEKEKRYSVALDLDEGGIPIAELPCLEAVLSSISRETGALPELQANLGPDELRAATSVLPRKYLDGAATFTPETSCVLTEKEFSMVVDLVLEKLSGTLKSVVPAAADEVLKKKSRDNC
jgi:CheY-like chemotaxis protein